MEILLGICQKSVERCFMKMTTSVHLILSEVFDWMDDLCKITTEDALVRKNIENYISVTKPKEKNKLTFSRFFECTLLLIWNASGHWNNHQIENSGVTVLSAEIYNFAKVGKKPTRDWVWCKLDFAHVEVNCFRFSIKLTESRHS